MNLLTSLLSVLLIASILFCLPRAIDKFYGLMDTRLTNLFISLLLFPLCTLINVPINFTLIASVHREQAIWIEAEMALDFQA